MCDAINPLIVIPEWAQVRRVEDCWCNSCTVHRWVGVNGPDENLDLRLHPLCLLCVLTHHSEASDTLTWGQQQRAKCWPTQKYSSWCHERCRRVRKFTNHRDPCSWQRTETAGCCDPAQWSSGRPRRHGQCLHWQSLDRPCRRTPAGSSSARCTGQQRKCDNR